MRRQLYHFYKEHGTCVQCGTGIPVAGILTCARCRAYNKADHVRHREERNAISWAWANRDTPFAEHGPPLLACCGQWVPILAIPFTCPSCATTYFKESISGHAPTARSV